MTRWYRAYEGTCTDAKLAEIAAVSECSRSVVIAVWHCILESAASANDGGKFDTTPRRIAAILGEPTHVIESIFAEMTALGMLYEGVVSAWTKRQFASDNSTERSRKHRATKRNTGATLHGRCATPPYTETEKEIDKENSAPRKKRAAVRKSALAEDWEPSPEHIAAAAKEGLSLDAAHREARKFRDYHRSKGTMFVDWMAAWRNWIRKAVEINPNLKKGQNPDRHWLADTPGYGFG